MADQPNRGAGRPLPKRERLYVLARNEYEPRRATRWPYLLRSGRQFQFEGPGRRELRADLRSLWRDRYLETVPSDQDLNGVIDDMKRLALAAEPDEPDAGAAAEEILAARGVDPAADGRGISLVTALADCPLPDGYAVPEPYVVTPDGIHLLKGDGSGAVRVAWAWLFPVRVFADPDGDQLVELAWRDGGRWVSRLVRRSIAKSGRKLIAEVGDAGLPVIEGEARQAERWLAAAEAADRDVIARHPVARQLGWQADGTFVTGQDTPWRVEPRYPDQAAALSAHRAVGTLAGWKAALEAAQNHLVVQAGAFAGLASPLLRPLGLDSFTVDFSGRSTRGKTITAMVALSCWADPGDRSEGMFSWQTASVIGVEKRLNLVNGLTVVIDETRLVRDPALVDEVLYSIPKNHGRPRGGGWPNMIPWRAVVVTTGEQPATSFTTHQGASARVLSVRTPPFGTGGGDSRTAAEAVKSGIEGSFGVAGPTFAARLRARLAEDDGPGKLRARHRELTDLLRGDTDMSGRRAPVAACLALAAELAAEWGIVPFAAPEPSAWASLFAADEQRDNRPEMALDVVREFIAANDARMWRMHPDTRAPSAGWIGRDCDEGPGLLPGPLGEALKRRGYELDAVLPGWLEMAALVTLASQRKGTEHLINRRIEGRQVRHLIFRHEVLQPPDQEDGQ